MLVDIENTKGNVVYLMRCQDQVKIGRTGDIAKRLWDLRKGNPYLELAGIIECQSREESYLIEYDLHHNKFPQYHIDREWFQNVEEISNEFNKHICLECGSRIDMDTRENCGREVYDLELVESNLCDHCYEYAQLALESPNCYGEWREHLTHGNFCRN